MTMQTFYQEPYLMTKPLKYGPYREQGVIFAEKRRALKLSQAAVADVYGAAQGYISEIERGWVNFSGSDLLWFERMSRALSTDVKTLMRDLGVKYVISDGPNHEVSDDPTPLRLIAPSGYASILIQVTHSGELAGATVQERAFIVPEDIAHLTGLAGVKVTENHHIKAGFLGMVGIYADITPELNDVVAIEMEGIPYLAYYGKDGYVITDSPITARTPLEFMPTKILGVVQTFVSSEKPRRVIAN